MSTTLVKNGTVITASDRYDADIYIDKGVITHIGQGLSMPADTVVDASGNLVMPGGIDVHTHLDMPFGGTTSADDFESGTIAAAHGGDPPPSSTSRSRTSARGSIRPSRGG